MARNIDYFSRNIDFDDIQPCFYEDNEWEEKFTGTPAPSEDIWKKFELLPTPPRSPRRDEEDEECQATFCSNPTHKLSLVSGFLEYDDPITQTFYLPISDILIPSGSLKSNLIQDCMWSGFQGEESTKTQTIKTSTLDETTASAKCVDPATVFPYPVSDTTNRDHSYSASASCRVTADTPSDSEDEIDVVTVEKLQFPRKQHLTSATPVRPADLREQLTAVVAGIKCKRSAHLMSMPSSPQPKKIRYSVQDSDSKVPLTKLSRSICSSRSSSRASSDSEECEGGKRSQHNVLERKRRNDLKFSFLRLRDHVPDLENQERAAKVVILKKATDYINGLTKQHQKYAKEMNAEQERKERLLERLAELKSFEDSDFF